MMILEDPNFPAGSIFKRNHRNLSTLDPIATYAQKTDASSSLGLKKMSLTPARSRVPKIQVGPGAISILSDRFQMEQ